MAQPGSAEVLGTSGRRFESCCPDHLAFARTRSDGVLTIRSDVHASPPPCSARAPSPACAYVYHAADVANRCARRGVREQILDTLEVGAGGVRRRGGARPGQTGNLPLNQSITGFDPSCVIFPRPRPKAVNRHPILRVATAFSRDGVVTCGPRPEGARTWGDAISSPCWAAQQRLGDS
jgi:hypothetical protein